MVFSEMWSKYNKWWKTEKKTHHAWYLWIYDEQSEQAKWQMNHESIYHDL